MELYKKFVKRSAPENDSLSSSDAEDFDPWVLPCSPDNAKTSIKLSIDATLIVRCSTGLNREIIESLLPKLRDSYLGSGKFEDVYMAIFIGLLNSVQGAKMEFDYPVWKSGFSGRISFNILRDIPLDGPIQPGKMHCNCHHGGQNIRVEYDIISEVSSIDGMSLDKFLPGKMNVKKKRIFLLSELLRMKLMRIEHTWYINNG